MLRMAEQTDRHAFLHCRIDKSLKDDVRRIVEESRRYDNMTEFVKTALLDKIEEVNEND